MTYVAVLRNAEAAAADVARYEPQIVARVATACPAAKCVASGSSSSKCLDLFETPDDASASAVCRVACRPGLTETMICDLIPWDLFENDSE